MDDYRPNKLLNRYFVATWLIALLLQLAQSAFTMTTSVYVVIQGFSNTFAGTLALFYSAVAIIGRLVSAYICDFKSRRLCMMIGCALFAAASVLFAMPALAIPVVLLLLRGLHGFGYAAGTTGYYSACVDVTPAGKTSLGLGLNSTAQGAAQLIAGVVGTLLVFGTDHMPLYLFAAGTAVAGVIFASTCNYEKKYAIKRAEKEKGRGIRLSDVIEKKAFPAALLTLVLFTGISAAMFFAVAAANDKGIQGGSLFFTACAFSVIPANIGLVRLAEKIGRIPVMIPVCVSSGAGLFFLGYMRSFTALIVAGILYGISMGCIPIIMTACVEGLPPNRRGAGTSTYYLAMDLAMGFGPILWGALIDAFGFEAAFSVAGSISFASLALLYFSLKDRSKAAA